MENGHKFIFVGDYFDSFNIDMLEQIRNFQNLIEFKNKNFENVELLIGNHDFHYMSQFNKNTESRNGYSGFSAIHKFEIGSLLNNVFNDGLLKVCHIHENLLYSHAGITKTWLEANNIQQSSPTLESEINNLFIHNPERFHFTYGINLSMYGDDINQGPFWIRPNSLKQDRIDYYTQIVGHTYQNEIQIRDNLIFIDVLDTHQSYLSYEDFQFEINNIPND